jgi:hypothetical protein
MSSSYGKKLKVYLKPINFNVCDNMGCNMVQFQVPLFESMNNMNNNIYDQAVSTGLTAGNYVSIFLKYVSTPPNSTSTPSIFNSMPPLGSATNPYAINVPIGAGWGWPPAGGTAGSPVVPGAQLDYTRFYAYAYPVLASGTGGYISYEDSTGSVPPIVITDPTYGPISYYPCTQWIVETANSFVSNPFGKGPPNYTTYLLGDYYNSVPICPLTPGPTSNKANPCVLKSKPLISTYNIGLVFSSQDVTAYNSISGLGAAPANTLYVFFYGKFTLTNRGTLLTPNATTPASCCAGPDYSLANYDSGFSAEIWSPSKINLNNTNTYCYSIDTCATGISYSNVKNQILSFPIEKLIQPYSFR